MNIQRLILNLSNIEKQCNHLLAKDSAILVSLKTIIQNISIEYKKAKEDFRNHQFQTQDEEINYFKLYNSQLIKLCLYYHRVQKIEQNLLSKSLKKQLSTLKDMMAQMDKFSAEYQAFIIYIQSESTHHDEMYFTMNPSIINQALFSSFERDPDFSTHHSFLLGKILSVLLTYQYIDNKLEQLKNKSIPTFNFKKASWNKTKTDFVELVYAIHASGAIDIEITKLFELFNHIIETGPLDEFNKWNNIKNRANSQPRFIPKLLQALQNKINQDFE